MVGGPEAATDVTQDPCTASPEEGNETPHSKQGGNLNENKFLASALPQDASKNNFSKDEGGEFSEVNLSVENNQHDGNSDGNIEKREANAQESSIMEKSAEISPAEVEKDLLNPEFDTEASSLDESTLKNLSFSEPVVSETTEVQEKLPEKDEAKNPKGDKERGRNSSKRKRPEQRGRPNRKSPRAKLDEGIGEEDNIESLTSKTERETLVSGPITLNRKEMKEDDELKASFNTSDKSDEMMLIEQAESDEMNEDVNPNNELNERLEGAEDVLSSDNEDENWENEEEEAEDGTEEILDELEEEKNPAKRQTRVVPLVDLTAEIEIDNGIVTMDSSSSKDWDGGKASEERKKRRIPTKKMQEGSGDESQTREGDEPSVTSVALRREKRQQMGFLHLGKPSPHAIKGQKPRWSTLFETDRRKKFTDESKLA